MRRREFLSLLGGAVAALAPMSLRAEQSKYNSHDACVAAGALLYSSAEDMRHDIYQEAGKDPLMQQSATMRYPHVSAVCTDKWGGLGK
jgi:hypothetical protein